MVLQSTPHCGVVEGSLGGPDLDRFFPTEFLQERLRPPLQKLENMLLTGGTGVGLLWRDRRLGIEISPQVEGEEAVHRFLANQKLQGLGHLEGRGEPGSRRQNPRCQTGLHAPGRGYGSEDAAQTVSRVGTESGNRSTASQAGSKNPGYGILDRIIIDQVARCKIVRCIQNQVWNTQPAGGIPTAQLDHAGVDFNLAVNLLKGLASGNSFRNPLPGVLFAEKTLALNVREFDEVAVDERESSNSCPGQHLSTGASQRTTPDDDHCGTGNPLLTSLPDGRKGDLSGVTVRHFDSVPSCFGDLEMTPPRQGKRRRGAAGTSRQARRTPKRARGSRSGARPGARSFRAGMKRLGRVALLAAAVAGAAVTLHCYTVYSRWIDALLVTDSPVSRVIRAAPFRLSSGDHLRPEQFLSQLRRAGYGEGRKNEQLWFERSGQEILFGRSDQVWQARFSGARLAVLSLNGKTVQSAQLEPLFLSSFASSGRQRIRPLQYEDLPSHLIQAVISAEDDRFFRHGGIDLLGIARALMVNTWHWEIRQGGSTLTQQFVKNYFLHSERLLSRKLQEVFLALLVERSLSKQEIFRLYANDVYLGQIGSFAIHGLGQGTRVFFGKECEDLTLGEAATLAAMIPAPNKYSPYRNPDLLEQRRNGVLDLMEKRGYVTARQNLETRSQGLRFRKPRDLGSTNAPYFVDFITRKLAADPRVDLSIRSDIELFSTLDPDLQIAAFHAARTELERIEKMLSVRRSPPDLQVALIAADPRTGQILAMIGGRRYAQGQYNRATRALRQPGSTFKPFVFAAALEESRSRPDEALTLATPVLDAPYTMEFGGREYSPRNYGNQYSGMVSVRDALARSLNVSTVKLAEWTGLDKVARLSERMGFPGRLEPYPSLALGSYEVSLLELTQGYQVLANRGRHLPLHAWTRMTVDGQPLQEEREERQIISPQTAFLVTSALQTALDQGTGRMARQLGFDLPAAGKTGTTSDSWFVGYTPDLLCAVWVGTDHQPDLNLAGASAALPVWTQFMKQAQELGRLSAAGFQPPAGVLELEIDERSGLKASSSCKWVRKEFFLQGTEPRQVCRRHQFAENRRAARLSPGQRVVTDLMH